MKLNKIPKSELESLPYTTLAKMYLQENKTTKNTADLFKEICKLLELSENDYVDKIADFFESLTTSKEFILLEDGTWDLRDHHSCAVNLEETEDEEDLTETEEEIEDEMNDMAPEEYHDMDDEADVDDTDIDEVDELEEEELTIIDEDELD